MKRILILLILILCFHISDAVGQSFVVASNPAPVTTQLNDGRYEFIQSPVNSSLHFLLDKFTGNVWRYKMSKDEFDELKRENPDTVVVDKINYQIHMGASANSNIYLLNIHTGEMWRYSYNKGESFFKKMSMPWHCTK